MATTASCPDPRSASPTRSCSSCGSSGPAVLDDATHAWLQALALRGGETIHHTLRVTDLAARLSCRVSIPDEQAENLRRGAVLHDIGKLAVPDCILLKPGPLSESDWQVMRQHPALAYQFLKPLPFPEDVLEIPYCHHERWDGSGYPRGLKHTQIPLSARIFAVVDVWDALCSDRPYRAAWHPDRARQHITEQAGRHFDPGVVYPFLEMLEEDSLVAASN